MTNPQIRQKLNNFLEKFKLEAGSFKSFETVHDYVSFLKAEPYIVEKMAEIMAYTEAQKTILEKIAPQMENLEMSLDTNPVLPHLPFFSKEMQASQKMMDEKKSIDSLDVNTLVPLFLTMLLMIHDLMASLKENASKNNSKEVERQIAKAKDVSAGFSSVKVLSDKSAILSNSKFIEACLELTNKFIIDQIDSEEFLNKDKTRQELSFNEKNSILNLYGEEIKIALKNDKPTDHFILEAIFDRKDIGEEIDFKDIALDYIKMEEYDGSTEYGKFRHACDRLNKKVDKSTNGKIKDFILYHTGKTGWCKINPKYL